MLILWDIDGTLLNSNRAGVTAMLAAARALFGASFSFEGVEIAGRLDPLIWADAARANGISAPDDHHETFRATYAAHLRERFRTNPSAVLLPGVRALVDALASREAITQGVLTGNYPETGQMKLREAGLDPALFPVAAWGSEGASRRDLPAVAMERYRATTGRALGGEQVIVIGDTPHDIDCAHHNGCRALGVATGPSFTGEDLVKAGADLVVETLEDTMALLDWITRSTPVRRCALGLR